MIAEVNCKNDPMLCREFGKFPAFVCYKDGIETGEYQNQDPKKKIDMQLLKAFIEKQFNPKKPKETTDQKEEHTSDI